MQRQRGELVPVAEALADLPCPVQALIPSPPTNATSPLPIRCTSLFRPAKRTRSAASWRG